MPQPAESEILPLSRRDFLRTGSLAAGLGITCVSDVMADSLATAQSCIVLWLAGGPSQLETWDPKPGAPVEVRGPFGAIATSVVGIRVGEHLPRLAAQAHRYALVRTVHHTAAPIHETGLQLLQTGHLSTSEVDYPHFGALLSRQRGSRRSGAPPFVLLPSRLGNMGLNLSHGQGAGMLGPAYEPQVQADFTPRLALADRDRYGKTPFGDACLRSLQLVEQGTRCVVVNMFTTVYDSVSWDCHAQPQSLRSTLDDYRRTLCPTVDHACAALLDDLHQRGLLEETLVLVLGEMGRTPRLNEHGGRDHWPGCWSILMAGGGVRGGQVIGVSDRLGAEPAQRPVACTEVLASIHQALGLPLPALHGTVSPVRELFR